MTHDGSMMPLYISMGKIGCSWAAWSGLPA
jgi:hypothetical protein